MSTIQQRNIEIKRRYLNGESTSELERDFGVTSRQIRRTLNQMGVDTSKRGRTPKYVIDTDFFKRWTAEMAYVLGFVITDGCIIGNQIMIAQKDREILERIAKSMRCDYPIKERVNGGGVIYTLTISRKSVVEDIRNLGVTERKSLTAEFPEVPTEFLSHFIRGVVDGDGWVHGKGYTMNITTASEEFAESLRTVFERYKFNTRITAQETKDAKAYRVWVSGKHDIIRLGRWLYADSGDLFMQRKRDRFEINAA